MKRSVVLTGAPPVELLLDTRKRPRQFRPHLVEITWCQAHGYGWRVFTITATGAELGRPTGAGNLANTYYAVDESVPEWLAEIVGRSRPAPVGAPSVSPRAGAAGTR